jgi:hypothetical protein
MKTDKITIHVDPEVAMGYRAASEDDRRKMDLLVNFQLTEFLCAPQSLEEAIEELSRESQQSELTPEILESMLRE